MTSSLLLQSLIHDDDGEYLERLIKPQTYAGLMVVAMGWLLRDDEVMSVDEFLINGFVRYALFR